MTIQAPAPLPYGPTMTRLLEPLRRCFRVFNTYVAVPAIRVGAGPLLATSQAGSIMVLRTVGRKSGLVREAPLGYTVLDGRVLVIAGYGRKAHWFRNALANPEVEVALPGAVLGGRAQEVTEPEARRAAFRAVMAALGVVGKLTLGDVALLTDEEVDGLAEAFPVLAITPTEFRTGPFDPGGVFTRVNLWLWAGGTALAVLACVRRVRS
jgi:deazaflavin-dependent oxidoreductase (nitroreductase family)